MVRMSDILRSAKERERRAEEEKKAPPVSPPQQTKTPVEPVKKTEPVKPEVVKEKQVTLPEPKAYEQKSPQLKEQRQEKAEISKVRISPVVMKGAKAVSNEETLKLYEQAVSSMKEILTENIDYQSLDIRRITTPIEKIVDQLSLGNVELLRLAFIKDSKDENYLVCHSINVSIYSIEVGLGLGYEKSRLIELGISAILHDLGMQKYHDLSNQPKKLTAREYNKIKNHTIDGSAILEQFKDLNKVASQVAYQQHERVDGSGYPRGLKGESIHKYAKIVGLVDAYEAMIHLRSYRDEFQSSEAIQRIIDSKIGFDPKLIKILIERIGIFPIGSIAELSTREIAQVVKLNQGVPMRPVVKILYEVDGEAPRKTKMFDLLTHTTVYIKKGLRKSEAHFDR